MSTEALALGAGMLAGPGPGGFGAVPSGPGWLAEVARHDPRLAHALIRPDLLGWGDPTCGWGWEMLSLTGTFDATAANQNVEGQLQGIIAADLWVRKVTYTVRRPNAFAGNVFKAQSDHFNRLNPNIDFSLLIKSHCVYSISPDLQPLENIENLFECVCPVGFVLACNAQMVARFTNNRALASDEVNTEAIITFHAVRLQSRYDLCTVPEAVEGLRKYGLLKRGE